MTQKYKMNAISLFSGCGGLDYGFEKAGFHVSFYNDSDKYCCETLRLNQKSPIAESPISEISANDIYRLSGLTRNGIDVLLGGPPCQPFSKSAYWNGGDTLRLKDPRADTLSHYFRLIEDLQPQVFLLENVHGLNYSGKEDSRVVPCT